MTARPPRRGASAVRRPQKPVPDLVHELALARRILAARSAEADAGTVIVGLDEVGRGALAGPVCVGACAVLVRADGAAAPLPDAVRDSKALTAQRREALVDPIRSAAHAWSVGEASAAEIDAIGIMGALALAADRALASLGCEVDGAVLDGDTDFLAARSSGARAVETAVLVKADARCSTVAAASILAKVARDALMVAHDALEPRYGWASNKGYGSAQHRAAIEEIGPHALHRLSWSLPGRDVHAARTTAAQPDRAPLPRADVTAGLADVERDVLWALEALMHDETTTRKEPLQ